MIAENPCRSSSVRPDEVHVLDRQPQHLTLTQAATTGQIHHGSVTLHVVRQVKLIRNRPVFAPPKGGRTRTVPLPESVARSVEEHISQRGAAAAAMWPSPSWALR
ncbi:hypothetical protein ACFC0R_10205 [Streptomyces sp. NPDC056086]|uniref:hypothetical protein n=1 Tax=Streptomyces sp. NPDC056086 TaxID=3345709 RepID=UPI0035D6B135